MHAHTVVLQLHRPTGTVKSLRVSCDITRTYSPHPHTTHHQPAIAAAYLVAAILAHMWVDTRARQHAPYNVGRAHTFSALDLGQVQGQRIGGGGAATTLAGY